MRKLLFIFFMLINFEASAGYWINQEPKEPAEPSLRLREDIDEPYIEEDDGVMDKYPFKDPDNIFDNLEVPERQSSVKEPHEEIFEPELRFRLDAEKEPQPLLLEPQFDKSGIICPKGLRCE